MIAEEEPLLPSTITFTVPTTTAQEADGAGTAEHEAQVGRLLSAYRAKQRDDAEVLGEEGGADAEPDLSAFGPRDAAVDGFADFSARVSRAPTQCVRYTFAPQATPLWAGRQRQLDAAAVPRCERCGAARRFEFQVMPQALHYMRVDSTQARSATALPPLCHRSIIAWLAWLGWLGWLDCLDCLDCLTRPTRLVRD